MKSTGDFHPATDATGDESNASLAASLASGASAPRWAIKTDQSCTPWKSTPAAKIYELRASARAVSSPPYEPPQMPMRLRSTYASPCKYFAPATTSLYSAEPRQPLLAGSRNARPYIK